MAFLGANIPEGQCPFKRASNRVAAFGLRRGRAGFVTWRRGDSSGQGGTEGRSGGRVGLLVSVWLAKPVALRTATPELWLLWSLFGVHWAMFRQLATGGQLQKLCI